MMHRGFFFGGPHAHGPRLVLVVLLLAIAAAAVTAIVLFLRERGASRPGAPIPQVTAPSSEASRILDERYARGEIDDEEYQRRRAVLASST
jgi:putative membrane protein